MVKVDGMHECRCVIVVSSKLPRLKGKKKVVKVVVEKTGQRLLVRVHLMTHHLRCAALKCIR